MAITADSLRWYQSERMTDEDDGGGQMTGTEIVPGDENQVFDDLSDVDRAAGDVSLRKVYAAVASNDDDKYLDAGAVVMRHPTDPDVSVTIFSTGDYYDERAQMQALLESSITRGEWLSSWLWGNHFAGQRVITIWQRFSADIPPNGARVELVALEGGAAVHSQVLWVVSVTVDEEERADSGGTYWVRKIILELAEALRGDYTGGDPSRIDPSNPATAIYGTRYNPEVAELCGIRPLATAAEVGDYTVQVDSLYAPLIPTALVETPLADTNPGGGAAALVPSGPGPITYSTSLDCVKPGVSLFIGSAVWPGSLSIVVSGSTITDGSGILYRSGEQVGTIDYGTGVCSWSDNCPAYGTASKAVTFSPAARPLKVGNTDFQSVTLENRGFVWIKTITPPPAPGSLQVSYQVNREWYTLADLGSGVLRGADSSYGSGNINYISGTATLTLGALPDPDTQILYAWAGPITYVNRGATIVDAPRFDGTVEHPGVVPSTFSVGWGVNLLEDDGLGTLTGTGGTGHINYTTGEWWIRPTSVPSKGAQLVMAYDYGAMVSESTANLNPDINSMVFFTLDQLPEPGTLRVNWNCGLYRPTVDESALMTGVYAMDMGDGTLMNLIGLLAGQINYVTGEVELITTTEGNVYYPIYEKVCTGGTNIGGGNTTVCTTVLVGYVTRKDQLQAVPSQSYQCKYRPAGQSGDPGDETVAIGALAMDITPQIDERLTPGSVRFRLGGSTYIAVGSTLYRDPSPTNGVGSYAGTIDAETGRILISEWVGGGTNTVYLDAAVTEIGSFAIGSVSFRTPVANIRPGTLQLRWTGAGGAARNKTIDSSGFLEDADASVFADYSRGVVHIFFGQWWVDAELTIEQKEEEWYDPARVTMHNGVLSIWQAEMVFADTLIYNAVAQVMLPPDSDLLGLDAARLPPDGSALIFRTGMLALIHHTDSVAQAELLAAEVVDCGRTRLYRVVIEDVNGLRLTQDLYTVDREAGTVTMADPLDLGDYTAPFTVYHTVADLQRVRDTDINGRLTFMRQVSHEYPDDGNSYVSGMLYIGTLQARYLNLFEQSTWTGVWSDDLIGNAPLASFNDALYPIVVTNAGAYPDRFLVRFTSSTAFDVIGENLGLIGIGDINNDCAPTNPLTGKPYFTIPYKGWGGGWATGNCLRFTIDGACFPVDMVRAVQPSSPTGLPDSVEVLLVGNVDSP